jgi:hypothetical protein
MKSNKSQHVYRSYSLFATYTATLQPSLPPFCNLGCTLGCNLQLTTCVYAIYTVDKQSGRFESPDFRTNRPTACALSHQYAKVQLSPIASRRLWNKCAANSNSRLSLFPQLRPFIGHVPKDVCSRPVFCGAFLHQRLHGPKKRRLYWSGSNRGVIRSCLDIALLGTN